MPLQAKGLVALGLAALPLQALADDGVVHWQCKGDYDITTEYGSCCSDTPNALIVASPYPDEDIYWQDGQTSDPVEDGIWETSSYDEPGWGYPKLRWQTKGGKAKLTVIDSEGARVRIVAEGCRPAQGKSGGQTETSGGIAP